MVGVAVGAEEGPATRASVGAAGPAAHAAMGAEVNGASAELGVDTVTWRDAAMGAALDSALYAGLVVAGSTGEVLGNEITAVVEGEWSMVGRTFARMKVF